MIKRPKFPILVVMVLSLAIGANSSVFSMVSAVLLRPLPFKQSASLVWVWATRRNVSRAFFSIPNLIDIRDQNRSFAEIVPFALWGTNLTGSGEAERLQGIRIAANAFQMLGVEAASGRTLVPEDDNPNSARVVVLNYGFWQRRFGGANDTSGKTLTLNGEPYTIVGVLPQSFSIPNTEIDIAVPLRMDSDARRSERGSNFLRLLARLKPGVTTEQAQADLAEITNRLRVQYTDENGNLTAPRVLSLQDEMTGGYQIALWVLLAAVVAILLIACSNLAGFQLARAASRHHEIAIRSALGASKWRLVRQSVTESTILAFVAGILGLLISVWAKTLLLKLSPGDFPRAVVTTDSSVLIFSLGATIFSAFVLGILPATNFLKKDLAVSLKRGERGGNATSGLQIRNTLIVGQIALSMILLIGAGLLIRSFARLRSVTPGFDAARVIAVRLSLPQTRYSTGAAVKVFYDRIGPRLGQLTGVESVGAISALPLSGMNVRTDFMIAGRPPDNPIDMPGAQHRWITPTYFQTMKIPLIRGRQLTERDNEHAPGAIVIDRALEQRFFQNTEALGSHLLVNMSDGNPALDYEIVGIVENVKHNGLSDDPLPTLYGPMSQAPKSAVPSLATNLSLVVRGNADGEALRESVRRELRSIDEDVPISGVRKMSDYLDASVAARKFNLQLISVFAITSLFLAAAGLYAVVGYLVSQRTREIGIRLALGARQKNVLLLMFGEGMKLTAIGLIIGLLGSVALCRLMKGMLFEVAPTDLMTFAVASVVLGTISLLACYLPARHAMKVNPLVALRSE
jgi:putative ABC transport system permease protein